ncbi:LuxR C-terminal-related transcriptional regulator [Actinoplanes sp. NPDC051513]|uniref:helix-turn-helix transcriptional regulator n=1 Tax=Actinoplanes sp. NPDC051513 TaxID=3363908 RepID=UPI0037B9BD14
MTRNSNSGVLTVGRAVPSLVRWGVSADADLVYRYLASFGPRPAGEVAADLGLAVRRVRAALDELDGCGAAGTDGVRWRASPVDAAVATLRRRALHPAAAPAGRADQVVARRLPDRAATRRRIAELVTVERGEHLAMNPEQTFGAETLAIATPMDTELLRRRIRLRSLGRPPTDGDRSTRRAEEFVRLGGEYREAARLPYKLMIFDRRVALMAVDPLDLDGGTWEIDEPAVVAALVTLFVRHWSGATDPRRKGVPTVVLTPREKAVVALLAEGHTDATAAKCLGMSQRSVTYLLRGVMDRFGVENRFQLGLALGATHAVTPPGHAGEATTEESEQ